MQFFAASTSTALVPLSPGFRLNTDPLHLSAGRAYVTSQLQTLSVTMRLDAQSSAPNFLASHLPCRLPPKSSPTALECCEPRIAKVTPNGSRLSLRPLLPRTPLTNSNSSCCSNTTAEKKNLYVQPSTVFNTLSCSRTPNHVTGKQGSREHYSSPHHTVSTAESPPFPTFHKQACFGSRQTTPRTTQTMGFTKKRCLSPVSVTDLLS
jgi:hypothetical protein